MRNRLCTLFDRNYLARALVLHRSLVRSGEPFALLALCMDEASERILTRLAPPCLEVLPLRDLEAADPELAAVRPTRSQVEYCWTATASLCLHALERDPEAEAVTYLDADLMFQRGPGAALSEANGAATIIVPHRYAPEHAQLEPLSGTYNVELMTFHRDADGLEALRWWRERCIEWCYQRHENGKFGDQKYLDDWPTRFRRVHVARSPAIGLAPWNASAHRLERRNGEVTVDGDPLVFYHHHALRLFTGVESVRRLGLLARTYRYTTGPVRLVWQTAYPIGPEELELVWVPYIAELSQAMADIRRVEPGFSAGLIQVEPSEVLRATVRELVPAGVRRALRSTGRSKAA